jgi:hypothetical protein
MRKLLIGTVALAVLGLSACQDPSATAPSGKVAGGTRPPAEQDTCWRINSGAPRFVAVGRSVASEQNCAVYLEALRLEEHHDMVGVWNGVYIYAASDDIMTAASPDGPRYQLFQPSDRARIDASLTQQIADKKAHPASGQP